MYTNRIPRKELSFRKLKNTINKGVKIEEHYSWVKDVLEPNTLRQGTRTKILN